MSLSAQECYEEAAKALQADDNDAANQWRLLGDSISSHKREKKIHKRLTYSRR